MKARHKMNERKDGWTKIMGGREIKKSKVRNEASKKEESYYVCKPKRKKEPKQERL